MRAALVASLFTLGALGAPAPQGDSPVRTLRAEPSAEELTYWRALLEAPPPLRGWCAPLPGEPLAVWETPGEDAPEPLRRAAALVQRTLAREGLRTTLARALVALAPAAGASAEEIAAELARAGLPLDLIALFAGPELGEPHALVTQLVARAVAGAGEEELVAAASAAVFTARPTEPAFRAAPQGDALPIAALRVQLSRADPWLGSEDGGNLDLVRQVVLALPEARVFASVADEHAEALREELDGWRLERRAGDFTLLVEPLVVSQWAQDVGISGWVEGGELAVLVPRHATRGERGAHAPGESWLVEGFERAGLRVARSRLLFQGGNVLVVRDPAAGERLAVMGEAEVLRNVALGLSIGEVLELFRAELAVERCMVLPAVAFHVDQELSFRVHDGALYVFVHDVDAGLAMILGIALDVLERDGRVDPARATAARAALATSSLAEARTLLRETLDAAALAPDQWPRSFCALFSSGPADPGEANLDLVLTALEMAESTDAELVAAAEPFRAALERSFARSRAERALVVQALEARGWSVVGVPGLPGERGLDYVNALHTPEKTLVPSYGGLWEPLDCAVREAWASILAPSVEIVPIRAAESQRRQGAVHCSVALQPQAPR